MTEDAKSATPRKIECPATKEPAVRWFVIAGILILLGGWCLYDAKVKDKYPKPADDDPNYTNNYAKWLFNHWGPAVFIPIGLLCVASGIKSMKHVLVADTEGIGYAGKEKLRWDQLTKVDKSRLDEKGILSLEFGDKKLVLDSWKLQYFRDLIEFLQAHCPGAENLMSEEQDKAEP